jgi:hypothetical protein
MAPSAHSNLGPTIATSGCCRIDAISPMLLGLDQLGVVVEEQQQIAGARPRVDLR